MVILVKPASWSSGSNCYQTRAPSIWHPTNLARRTCAPTPQNWGNYISKRYWASSNRMSSTNWFWTGKGSLDFCIDFRKLNNLTRWETYPILRVDECIESFDKATVFSILDSNSGWWKVEIEYKDRNKNVFPSHYGLLLLVRMSFALKNAPGTFQTTMKIILSSVKWQLALVYLEITVIFSMTLEKHIEHVEQVLALPQRARVTIKLKKCYFITDKID